MKKLFLFAFCVFSLRSMDIDDKTKALIIGRTLYKQDAKNPEAVGKNGIVGKFYLVEFSRSCFQVVKIIGIDKDQGHGYYEATTSLVNEKAHVSIPIIEECDLYELSQSVLEKLLEKLKK